MKNQGKQKLLGTKLIEAGIISEQQLKVALEDQRRYNLRIGEILKRVKPRQPIGYYLRRAALLNQTQISYILEEQEKAIKYRFGEIALQQKWLNAQTIEFFLKNLDKYTEEALKNSKSYPATALKRAILYINEPDIVVIERENIIYQRREREIISTRLQKQ